MIGRVDPTALANGLRVSAPQVFIGISIEGAQPRLPSPQALILASPAASLHTEAPRPLYHLLKLRTCFSAPPEKARSFSPRV